MIVVWTCNSHWTESDHRRVGSGLFPGNPFNKQTWGWVRAHSLNFDIRPWGLYSWRMCGYLEIMIWGSSDEFADLLSYLVSGLIHQHLVKLAPIFVLAYLQPMMLMMMVVGMMMMMMIWEALNKKNTGLFGNFSQTSPPPPFGNPSFKMKFFGWFCEKFSLFFRWF